MPGSAGGERTELKNGRDGCEGQPAGGAHGAGTAAQRADARASQWGRARTALHRDPVADAVADAVDDGNEVA